VTVRRSPGSLVINAKDEHGVHPNATIVQEDINVFPFARVDRMVSDARRLLGEQWDAARNALLKLLSPN
jgi:hypothetical protein